MRARSVRESELTQGPLAVIKTAVEQGWYTVATVGTGRLKQTVETSLVIRGWRERGEHVGHFVSVYLVSGDGSLSHDVSYLWRREHETTAELPTEHIRWTTEHATPDRVKLAELKAALKLEV